MRVGICTLVMVLGGCYGASANDEIQEENEEVAESVLEDDGEPDSDESVALDIDEIEPFVVTSPIQRRVLFMVDVSTSMLIIDPMDPVTGETRRTDGLRRAIEALLADERYETAISIAGFSSMTTIFTYNDVNGDGMCSEGESLYTSSMESLLGTEDTQGALGSLLDGGPSSNYRDALLSAQDVVALESTLLLQADSATEMEFFVILVGDFGLDSNGEQELIEQAILDEVRRLVTIGETSELGLLEVHCAHLAGGVPVVDQPATEFANTIADEGMGTVRRFEPNEELDLLFMEP